MQQWQNFYSEVLVIGGGVAGLFAAISARKAGRDVLVADKGSAGRSGASIMASGFWAVFNPDWGMELNAVTDWAVRNGEYLNDRNWLGAILEDSWGTYVDLLDWGVPFPVPRDQVRHFFKANLTCDPDDPLGHYGIVPLTHRGLPPGIRRYAEAIGVRFADRVMITDLVQTEGRVAGAVGLTVEGGQPCRFSAGAVVLTAGKNSFKAPGMHVSGQTGDADAMAYRAGAMLSGKEFPDMHLNIAKHPAWKGNGELYPAYFKFYDAKGHLLPNHGFDLSFAGAIHAGDGPVIWDFDRATDGELDAIHAYLKKRNNLKETQRVGLNPDHRGKWPMIGGAVAGGPAEHASGLWTTDTSGASTLPGLWSAGDCCCTWCWGAVVQGPPFGLMPAGVTGQRAGAAAAAFAKENPISQLTPAQTKAQAQRLTRPLERQSGYSPRWLIQLLQNTMMPWYVLHIKEGKRLEAALTFLDFFRDHMVPMLRAENDHELRLCLEAENMVLNAEMILRSSLARQESRGWHFREDYPHHDDASGLAWTRLFHRSGGMAHDRVALPAQWHPPENHRYAPQYLPFLHPEQEVL